MTTDQEAQCVWDQGQALGTLGGPINPPHPGDLAKYRAEQQAREEEHQARWAQERAAEAAERQQAGDRQLRLASLEAALRVHAGTGANRMVLEAARDFEAFLRGEHKEAAQ